MRDSQPHALPWKFVLFENANAFAEDATEATRLRRREETQTPLHLAASKWGGIIQWELYEN